MQQLPVYDVLGNILVLDNGLEVTGSAPPNDLIDLVGPRFIRDPCYAKAHSPSSSSGNLGQSREIFNDLCQLVLLVGSQVGILGEEEIARLQA